MVDATHTDVASKYTDFLMSWVIQLLQNLNHGLTSLEIGIVYFCKKVEVLCIRERGYFGFILKL